MDTRRPPTGWIVVALIVGFWVPTAGATDEEVERRINDCGVNSLYLLLRRCSVDVDLADLRRQLPNSEAHGLSMAEIQRVAGRRGVPLRGRRVGAADMPLDRPVIAFLKSRSEESPGHFVVLEPAGSLGKMALLLDFPRPVRAIDYADLMAGDAWTGLVLIPATWRERFGPWVVAAVGLALVSFGIAARRTRRPGARRGGPVAVGPA